MEDKRYYLCTVKRQQGNKTAKYLAYEELENEYIYIAHYTDNKSKRKIQLPVTAIDYAAGLVAARKLTEVYDYRFDDLVWKKHVKNTK